MLQVLRSRDDLVGLRPVAAARPAFRLFQQFTTSVAAKYRFWPRRRALGNPIPYSRGTVGPLPEMLVIHLEDTDSAVQPCTWFEFRIVAFSRVPDTKHQACETAAPS